MLCGQHGAAQKEPCDLFYDTKYHWVRATKYRKWIMQGDLQVRVKEIFEEIASSREFCDRSTGGQSRSCTCFIVFSSPALHRPGSWNAQEHQCQFHL